MRRPITRAQQRGRQSSARVAAFPGKSPSLVDAWWASVLAGDVYEPHPIHREVKVQLHGGSLRLSGELETAEDRDELVRQARQRIGHGVDHVDVASLRVASRQEKPGILEQTLISAFPGREAAEYARDFVLEHSRVVPKSNDVVDASNADKLRVLLREDFARQTRKAIDSGHALLILKVDETEAFKVRELLDEDTRSEWTVAVPPRLIEGRR
jgi:hypothetical protein